MSTLPDPRTALLARRAALLEQLRDHEQGSRVQHARELLAQDDEQAHDADRDVDLALSEHDREQLAALEAALARLAAGRYGVCDDCGEPITPDRLRVQPQALHCLACASRREALRGGPPRATL